MSTFAFSLSMYSYGMWKQQENGSVLSLHADWFASGIGKNFSTSTWPVQLDCWRWKAKVSPSTLTNMLMVLILELGMEKSFQMASIGLNIRPSGQGLQHFYNCLVRTYNYAPHISSKHCLIKHFSENQNL